MSYINEINLIINLLETLPKRMCDELEWRETKEDIRKKELELSVLESWAKMENQKIANEIEETAAKKARVMLQMELIESMNPGSFTVLGNKDE